MKNPTASYLLIFFAAGSVLWAEDKSNNNQQNQDPLEDFRGEDVEESWMTVNDNVMGGRSKGGFSVKKGKLLFSGSTNTNGGGFSSIRMKPREMDLAGKKGVVIRFKGDGRTYKFDARMGRSSIAHRSDFKTEANPKGWQTVQIPFADLTATWRGMRLPPERAKLDVAKISGMGFMIYDKKDGPFELKVDWIKTY